MKRSKKIILLIPHLDLGGGARRVQAYCRFLPQFGWSVSVSVFSENVLRDIDIIIGKDTPRCISGDPQTQYEFIQKQNPDALYGFFDGRFQPNLYQLLHQLKEKLSLKILMNNVFSYYDEKMNSLIDRVIFQSRHMALVKYQQNLPPHTSILQELKHISLLQNPVTPEYLEKFSLSEKEQNLLRKEFGWNENTFIVGRFGRNDIVKWGDQLLSAIWLLRKQQKISFLLVGVPTSRRYILKAFTFLEPSLTKRIRIVSPTHDDKKLMGMMQICNAVAHSVNIGEGCSNAINEALFWGKPVITTSTPHCDNGQTEQVLHGYNGYLAQNGSQFAAALLYLLTHPEKQQSLGQNGHNRVKELLSAQTISHRFANILNDTIQEETRTTISQTEYQSFILWYEKLLQQHPVYKPQNLWYKVFTLFRRVANYLEHTL